MATKILAHETLGTSCAIQLCDRPGSFSILYLLWYQAKVSIVRAKEILRTCETFSCPKYIAACIKKLLPDTTVEYP